MTGTVDLITYQQVQDSSASGGSDIDSVSAIPLPLGSTVASDFWIQKSPGPMEDSGLLSALRLPPLSVRVRSLFGGMGCYTVSWSVADVARSAVSERDSKHSPRSKTWGNEVMSSLL